MKPSEPGVLFAGRFLITISISVLVMGLLRFSISSWFSFGRFTFLRIYPFLPSCPFYWHIVADSSLLWSFVFLCCLLWFLHFHFKFCWFGSSTFFCWWVWVMVCLFCLSSQRTSFSFVDFCYGLLYFFCIYYCPIFYDLFPSTNPGVLYFFFF